MTRGPASCRKGRIFVAARALAALLLVAALAGCRFDALTRGGGHPPVMGAELVGADGTVLTPDVVLPPLRGTPVTVRFLDAAGRPIPDMDAEHGTRITVDGSGFLSVDTVPGQPLSRLLSVTNACPQARLYVGYGHRPFADERTFGPFPVRVSPDPASVRIFRDADGAELTPTIHLPAGETTRLQVRFYGCQGDPLEGLEDRYAIQLFWSPVLASVDEVPGQPFARDLTPTAAPGDSGQVTVAFGAGDFPGDLLFGPFTITID